MSYDDWKTTVPEDSPRHGKRCGCATCEEGREEAAEQARDDMDDPRPGDDW